ncbi:MAG: hypothetical protein JKY95_00455 [Planctomycetaceae bacterium]|nr:hypothetical protein [Planctomycetaceae bacterium]
MSDSNRSHSKQDRPTPPGSDIFGGYPPPSSHSIESIARPAMSAGNSRSQGMDRFLRTVLSFVGIIAVFILLVFLLKNISPDANESMDLNSAAQLGDPEFVQEPETDIIGD